MISGKSDARALSDREEGEERAVIHPRVRRWLAVIIPLLFLADVVAMFYLKLQGGDATALVGGHSSAATLTALGQVAAIWVGEERSSRGPCPGCCHLR